MFERTILKKIFSPVRDPQTVEFRWRHNEELMELARIPKIYDILRSERLCWAGHVARKGAATPKQVMLGNPEGRRPLGQPRKRWLECVTEDLTALGERQGRAQGVPMPPVGGGPPSQGGPPLRPLTTSFWLRRLLNVYFFTFKRVKG